MTEDKNQELKLSTISEAQKNYVSIARNYFSPKGKGANLSLLKKIFLWSSLLMSLGIMLPQVLSESKRQEVAEEIMADHNKATGSEQIEIPAIQNDDASRGKKTPSDSGGGGKRQSVDKIKSIDLRSQGSPPAGSEAFATLISGGANGMVKAMLTENLTLNGDLYAAKNSVLIGKGSSSDQRLFVKFSRIVSPEGKSKKISAQAYDFSDRIRGLIGKKVSDRMFKIAASSALIFLGGMADTMQSNEPNLNGTAPRKSMRDAALGGVAQATTEHGRRYLEELDRDNRIEVKSETQFVVIFEDEEDKNE